MTSSPHQYTAQELEALLNWDGLHCKPPFRHAMEERQYYARYIEKMLWRYLTPEDWQRLATIIDEIRVAAPLKKATVLLIHKHLGNGTVTSK